MSVCVVVALALALAPTRGAASPHPPDIQSAAGEAADISDVAGVGEAQPVADPPVAVDDGTAPLADDRTAPVADDGAIDPGEASGADVSRPPYASGSSHVPPPVAPPPRTPEPHPGVIGGYWDMDRTQGPEPDDGQEEIIAGSILVPLGLIAVSSSAATIWLSAPGYCAERWKALGGEPTVDQCKGVRVFGIIRVTYGGLMAITGSVLLGIGTHRREKNRKWHRGQALSPWFGEGGGGLVYGGRFGGRRF